MCAILSIKHAIYAIHILCKQENYNYKVFWKKCWTSGELFHKKLLAGDNRFACGRLKDSTVSGAERIDSIECAQNYGNS